MFIKRIDRQSIRVIKQSRNLQKLQDILEQLSIPASLPPSSRDHKLKGGWQDFRECHIQPDWLLIYTITDFELRPARLGTHTELFNK